MPLQVFGCCLNTSVIRGWRDTSGPSHRKSSQSSQNTLKTSLQLTSPTTQNVFMQPQQASPKCLQRDQQSVASPMFRQAPCSGKLQFRQAPCSGKLQFRQAKPANQSVECGDYYYPECVPDHENPPQFPKADSVDRVRIQNHPSLQSNCHQGRNVARDHFCICLLYTSPSPRDRTRNRMPSSA